MLMTSEDICDIRESVNIGYVGKKTHAISSLPAVLELESTSTARRSGPTIDGIAIAN